MAPTNCYAKNCKSKCLSKINVLVLLYATLSILFFVMCTSIVFFKLKLVFSITITLDTTCRINKIIRMCKCQYL